MKVGGGGGEVSFLSPPPLLALLLAPFFARSLTLDPRSLLLNHTETLATQANGRPPGNSLCCTVIFVEAAAD